MITMNVRSRPGQSWGIPKARLSTVGDIHIIMARCPHCKNQISFETIVMEQKGAGFLRQDVIYSCPHCESVLGVSRGKYG
ncbi:MAG: hypothetical protein AYK23_04900 [Candidatus Proteinoplasmatales archaeon SG8-5]|nr:MAG: hypothetical protein AYK23_04900 [Candidatus Proteinoplasmatales archaeon SG8-5]